MQLFDQLPVELFFILFEHFWAHEILFTFSDISDYVNTILASYSAYRLNLKSIRKSYFDLICHRIRPEQVISLILSDQNDTPGQSELFLSYFQIEQFIHLRSLTLIEMERDSLFSILPNLYKLNELRSFSFDPSSIKERSIQSGKDEWEESTRLRSILPNVYNQVLPRLKYLNTNYDLKSIPCPHLLHLKLDCHSFRSFDKIPRHAPQLRSVTLSLSIFHDFENILSPLALTQLSLTIKREQVSIDHVEQLLQKLPQLTRFEIKCKGAPDDIANGYQWQSITHSFTTFNFNFNVELNSIEQTLDSFRTPFWLEEKRWFVAYHNRCLFSVSSNSLTDISVTSVSSIYSTIPDHTIIYQCKRSIFRPAISINNKFRFTNINALQLYWPISPKILTSIIDLSQVQHLNLFNYTKNILKVIVRTMPRLHSLSIGNGKSIGFLKEIDGVRMERIRTLQFTYPEEQVAYVADILSHSFPNVEHLSTLCIRSRSDIIHIVRKLKQLSSISFNIHRSSEGTLEYFDFEPDLIINEIRQFTHSSLLCRVDRLFHHNGAPEYVHLWIGERSSPLVSDTYWPPRRGWCRMMDLMLNPYTDVTGSFIMSIISSHKHIPILDNIYAKVFGFVATLILMTAYLTKMIIRIFDRYTPFITNTQKCSRRDIIKAVSNILVPLMIGLLTIAVSIVQLHIGNMQRAQDVDLAFQTRTQEMLIANNERWDVVLATYIREMSDLFASENFTLSDSTIARTIRAKTIITLRQLDPIHKAHLVQFLYESGAIINHENPIDMTNADINNVDFSIASNNPIKNQMNFNFISLYGAMLINTSFANRGMREANLSFSLLINGSFKNGDLYNTSFESASLPNVNFERTKTLYVDFSGADLRGINITDEQLHDARSIFEAVLPNGTYGRNRNLLINGNAEENCLSLKSNETIIGWTQIIHAGNASVVTMKVDSSLSQAAAKEWVERLNEVDYYNGNRQYWDLERCSFVAYGHGHVSLFQNISIPLEYNIRGFKYGWIMTMLCRLFAEPHIDTELRIHLREFDDFDVFLSDYTICKKNDY